jgi:hypothetical protein
VGTPSGQVARNSPQLRVQVFPLTWLASTAQPRFGGAFSCYKLSGRITIGEFMLLLSAAIAAGAVAGFALAAIMVKAIFDHPAVHPSGAR